MRGRALGLRLAATRAMRCGPALCGSTMHAHLLGTVVVAIASSRHRGPRPRCLPHSRRIPCPPGGLRPPALRAYSQGFRHSEALCRCVAPGRSCQCSCPCFTLLTHACLLLSSADPAVADSHLPARRRPAGRRRATRTLPVAGRRAGYVNYGLGHRDKT